MTEQSSDTYKKSRLIEIQTMMDNNINPNPDTFRQTITSDEMFRKDFSSLSNNQTFDDLISIGGRVINKKEAGKLCFLTLLLSDNVNQKTIQCIIRHGTYDLNHIAENDRLREFKSLVKSLNRSDIIGVTGCIGKSNTGELSIFVTNFVILSRNVQILPTQYFGLSDIEKCERLRHLDMLINPKSFKTLTFIPLVTSHIRQTLQLNGFLEVSTSILSAQAGGAIAKPFITHLNDLNIDFYMRIAPELYLKMLIVSGMSKIFELGKQFRNEGIDNTHLPEFTSIEIYQAYVGYNEMMNLAEMIISSCVQFSNDKFYNKSIDFQLSCKTFDDTDNFVDIDFKPPFKRIDFITGIEEASGYKLPTEFDSDASRLQLLNILQKENIQCTPPLTTSRILGKLIEHYVEKKCINPTFICGHPAIMSPLAKRDPNNSQLTQRFELFIAGKEFANGYTEQNNIIHQRHAFEQQLKDKNNGDDEAHGIDEVFMNAIETGLPPTGGLGIGIDRLMMLLTGTNRIQNVVFFPPMKPKEQ